MAFKRTIHDGPYGNACYGYHIDLDHQYTIREFIDEVLKTKRYEWGRFGITEDIEHSYMCTIDVCEYRLGILRTGFHKDDIAKMKIKRVVAHGGQSNIDYLIEPIQTIRGTS